MTVVLVAPPFSPVAEAKVCVGVEQVAALVSAASNSEKEKQNQQNQPSLQNPPKMRALPAQRQYVGDGVYLPDNTKAQQQQAYASSRAALDHQPLNQPNPQNNSGSSSGIGWGTIAGMIPSGGGGKCRGICY